MKPFGGTELPKFRAFWLVDSAKETRRSPGVLAVMLLSTAVVAADGLWPAVSDALQVTDKSLANHEYWRLLTYVFPQENGWAHLAVNMFGLFLYGWQLERLVGTARLLFVYFASGAIGMVLLANVRDINELTGLRSGASLGCFGVIAAVACAYLIATRRFDANVRRAAFIMGVFVLSAALIGARGTPGVVDPGVEGALYSAANHCLGLVAGVLTGLAAAVRWRRGAQALLRV